MTSKLNRLSRQKASGGSELDEKAQMQGDIVKQAAQENEEHDQTALEKTVEAFKDRPSGK